MTVVHKKAVKYGEQFFSDTLLNYLTGTVSPHMVIVYDMVNYVLYI